MKQRNKLTPRQKQTFRLGGQVLMAAIIIGVFSYQFDADEELELSKDQSVNINNLYQDVSSQALEEAIEAPELVDVVSSESSQLTNTQTAPKTLLSTVKKSAKKTLSPKPLSILKTSLAVDYQGIAVSLSGNKCLLKWSSSYQRNIKSFAVERSIDDEFYESLGQLKGAGEGEFEGQKNFEFNDQTLRFTQMPRVFYRVKHEGYDGNSGYSDVFEYDLGLPEGLYAEVKQEDQKEIRIHYSSYKSGQINYKILNTFGEKLVQGELEAEFDPRVLLVEIDAWEKGSYYLELSDETYSLTQVFELE